MRLKASTDYGMRMVLYLAEKDMICSSRDVASEMSIPRDYLIQLAQLLRNAGIISARPGKHGGYSLAKSPEEISVLDVIDALQDEQNRPSKKQAAEGECDLAQSIASAFHMVERGIEEHLRAITLKMLIDYMHSSETDNEFVARQMQTEIDRLLAK